MHCTFVNLKLVDWKTVNSIHISHGSSAPMGLLQPILQKFHIFNLKTKGNHLLKYSNQFGLNQLKFVTFFFTCNISNYLRIVSQSTWLKFGLIYQIQKMPGKIANFRWNCNRINRRWRFNLFIPNNTEIQSILLFFISFFSRYFNGYITILNIAKMWVSTRVYFPTRYFLYMYSDYILLNLFSKLVTT